MSTSTSSYRGFILPGATINDTRLGDLQAIKSALIAIDSDLANSQISSVQKNTIGIANGVASLDSNGVVPSVQLPSYVDDILEFVNVIAFPVTGESSKIYVAINNNTDSKLYRWSGSSYVEIPSSPGSTDVVVEGVINKYFTNDRARAALSTTSKLSFNPATGVFDLPNSSLPYDIASAIIGKPLASAVVMRFIAVRSFSLPVALANSLAVSAVAATGSTVLTLRKNGTQFGTLTFSAGGTVGVFAAASITTFASGDVLTIVAPTTQDGTFADCEYTLVATLT